MAFRRKRKKEKKPAMILRLVRRYGYQPGRVMSEILEWMEVLVVAGLLAYLVITFITVRMSVPTGSMIPAIDPKDSFFVDKVSYYFRDPNPGDVVVFWHTESVSVGSVEEGSAAEVAGVPEGAQLAAINRQPVFSADGAEASLDDLPTDSRLTLTFADASQVDVGNKPADATDLDDLGIRLRERRMRYVKRLIAVGGQTVQIQGGDVYVNGEKVTDPRYDRYYTSNDPRMRYGVSETVVPEGHWFVLGDNSDNSWDSRYWGFVDESDFIGEPYIRVWPLNRFGLMNSYLGVSG